MAKAAGIKRVSKRIAVMVAITSVSVLLVLFTAYTKYIYAQDYNFIVEAPCNPEQATCYVRDCADYCPPNELEIYTKYLIPANEFSTCTDNSCVNVCQSETSAESCVQIICNPNNGNDCAS